MDGMLSQDEINALLSGVDTSSSNDTPAAPAPESAPQESASSSGTASAATPVGAAEIDDSLLTPEERDAIGEIANISMGSSATTLYSLVNRKVNITTPVVSLANWNTMIAEYERPCVFIQIKYTQGLEGSNILIMKERDVQIITDLMMGGDGTNVGGELGELHLSAISEAMNQMMGSSATSLSTMLGKLIDISPPEASLVDLTELKKPGEIADYLEGTFCKIAFSMQIEDLVDSTILQLYPIDFAKSLYATFMDQQIVDTVQESEPAPVPAPAPEPQPYVAPQVEAQPQMQMGMPQMAPQQMPNVQPAQFQNFAGTYAAPGTPENIGLIMDVPLEVTVELGRTTKSISEILDFAPGTIIELNKIAGEPIDVLVNGKFVAKGEVVVIEESFGIRVTEIIK